MPWIKPHPIYVLSLSISSLSPCFFCIFYSSVTYFPSVRCSFRKLSNVLSLFVSPIAYPLPILHTSYSLQCLTFEPLINISLSLPLMARSDGPNDNACSNYSKSAGGMLGRWWVGRGGEMTIHPMDLPLLATDLMSGAKSHITLYVMCVPYMCSQWVIYVCVQEHTHHTCCVFPKFMCIWLQTVETAVVSTLKILKATYKHIFPLLDTSLSQC